MPAFLLLAATLAAAPADTAPIECGACAEWNQPQAPFRLHGDSWYVGTKGLSAVLVATPEGLVLIDGALPQSAPLIAANVAALGFDLRDVRFLLNSHAHFDHAGGLAALQRLSGAPVLTTSAGARAMRRGATTHDDPQAGFGDQANGYPPIAVIQVIEDGGSVSVGDVVFRMHASPGHTPGGTTWTWRSCEGGDCRDLVYADSLTAVSAPGFRFSDDPPRVAEFRATIARVAALPCDLVVSAHPGFSGLFDKLAEREADPSRNTLLDPKACQAYARTGEEWLDRRLAEEAAPAPGG
ncbi:subclass B3 metallo-beta-lactamase [Arenimonas sp.]|uniref:subclass B3 metallo-beta-lactamase n=1 Tax=Arenimonas sp. TaxID=1872635 RepID=UPI0035B08C83